jgi:hypothetical protein
MGALRVAFKRREAPDSRIEFVEVLRCRQIMNIVENLDAFNFDMADAGTSRPRSSTGASSPMPMALSDAARASFSLGKNQPYTPPSPLLEMAWQPRCAAARCA